MNNEVYERNVAFYLSSGVSIQLSFPNSFANSAVFGLPSEEVKQCDKWLPDEGE